MVPNVHVRDRQNEEQGVSSRGFDILGRATSSFVLTLFQTCLISVVESHAEFDRI